MINYEKLKQIAAYSALKHIVYENIIGVGTGSTIHYFIEALSSIKEKIKGAVPSSEKTYTHLNNVGIPIIDFCNISNLEVYIDGADEINSNMQMIKGGGGALTREKILATSAKKFICIADYSKKVQNLGDTVPVPIEIIPMSRSFVISEIKKIGGIAKLRNNFITDNGNNILDIYKLKIINAIQLEEIINNIPGVLTVGIFAKRTADIAIIASIEGVETIIN